MKNLDIIWSSNYTRAKATAKYIANENNLQYILDKRLSKRKLGKIEDLAKFMNDKETRDPSYKGKELSITEPCLLKMTFKNNELVNLEQID